MIQYPLLQISKEDWNKKVAATYMYSIPAEDDALPILEQLVDLIEHLHAHPLLQVIAEEHIEYFFTQVFPPVCQKILKSRYFKNQKVLAKANKILELSTYLVLKYLDLAERYPAFADILVTVFNADEYYYKSNNQFTDYRSFASNFTVETDRSWVQELKEGDSLDVLKFTHLSGKAIWSRGKVVYSKPTKLKVQFERDYYDQTTIVDKSSYMIAPYKSKSDNFDWRMQLKAGDLIDCEDHYGSWYNSTVAQILERSDDRRLLRIAFKVYSQDGNKYDEKGRYYGLSGYTEEIDFTSPKIQPFKSIVRERSYFDSGSKTLHDNDDLNDSEFEELSGQKLYALPRKKYLSEFLFKALNQFGKRGGFTQPIQLLENHINVVFLSIYVKGISGSAQLLHKTLIKQIIQRLKPVIQQHIFNESQQFLKDFTKDRSEMLFSGFKLLQRRIYSMQRVYEYENEKKMKLVDGCLKSETLKRRLQGLNELKDIIKSLTYSSQRNKTIKKWVKDEQLFEKIYLTNSHVQLIKKSQDFFRFLINESILEVTDLQRLYKIAQKGDYESRISLYKLFQQVSHIFKKPHVDFLIDTILESELSVVLNQDIDLLNEMSKFSNYFPKDKVRSFFQSIILGENQHEALYEYATKKYCEVVAKGYEMKEYRRDIIHSFINKLTTHNIKQVSRVLKGIFEGIGVGEYGKKDLNSILAEEKIDEVVIQALINHKEDNNIVSEVLNLLGFIYKLSYKVKIYISTLKAIWNEMKGTTERKKQYFKWLNEFTGCEQGIGEDNELQAFEVFFRQLFPRQNLVDIGIEEFMLIKNLMLELNKKYRYLIPTHTMKDIEYKRKVDMDELKFYQYFMYLVYDIENEDIYERGLAFFLEIYNARDNELEDIQRLFQQALEMLKEFNQKQEWKQVGKTLKLINILIDNSQKKHPLEINSLQLKEKSEHITLIMINDIVYITDYTKKKQITVPLNQTLYEFKKTLTTLYTIELQEIKLTQDRQIPDYYNSRIIKELPINFNEPITISKRYISIYNEPEILINNKLHPKAVRCFSVIFERYSVNGLMSKENCQDFTSACLGTLHKRYDDKINSLYLRYDYDNDGFLTLEGFLGFYEDSARENKSGTVWSNLRSFGVDNNLRFANEIDQSVNMDLFPRKQLARNPQFYDYLFSFLVHKDLAPLSFQLLRRLPICEKVYHQVLGIESEASSELDIAKIFKFEDYYSYFYKLQIIAYLGESDLQIQKMWLCRFIASRGIQFLYSQLKLFLTNYQEGGPFESISIQIINYNIKILYQYFVLCFIDQKSLEALALLTYDIDIDDKIQYLVTGVFPKYDQKLPQLEGALMSQWHGEHKTQICAAFIDFLKKIWITWSDRIEKDHSKLFTYQKLLSIICLLQLNQDPTKLIEQFAVFFQKPPSNKILRQFYCLILNQCFYSNKGQDLYISELFKHITLTNIISDYFRMLAVLVGKFGMEEEKVSEMPEVLLRNILHEKNELTIEGCAKLLSNFHLSGDVAEKEVQLLWDNCLFGRETSCKNEGTRQAIYQLIVKVCERSKEITDKIIKRTQQTLQTRIKQMKITYSTEVNQRSTTGYVGIKNLGNICYMNSMLQQLYVNRTFRYLLMRIDDQKEPQWVLDNKQRMIDDNFLHQVQRIFAYLDKTTRLDFVPYALCQAYKPFGGEPVNIMIQQDVQEFVSMFFDRLEAGIKEHPLRRLIDNFYNGKYTNLFQCHQCKQTKKVQETFYSLSLEIKNSKNLAESFNRFILGELISDYKCDFCEKKADVSKKARISKAPHILIVHLQRIVFNLDTFINEKITTKHQFPMNFNLHPYTLDYYETQQGQTEKIEGKQKEFEYEISGVICHSGNAEVGHYISYIKNYEGKWFQFNDSLVNSFNPANLETECFGGSYTFDDEYDWQRRENSKSAYLLIYRRVGESKIEMQVDRKEDIPRLLQTLKMQELNPSPVVPPKSEEEPTQSQEESSDRVQDSEREREVKFQKEIEEIAIIKRHKSEDDIEVQNPGNDQIRRQEANNKIIVRIKDQIEPFIPNNLEKQIQADNETHFFEKCLASASFSKFFAKLLILPQSNSQSMVKLCQKLTFGFWLKSPSFKQLLHSLSLYIKEYPSDLRQILSANTNLVNLLIQNAEIDVRTNIASFLANSFSYLIQDKGLTLMSDDPDEDNQLIVSFLDNLFSLIPTTVSKCWTKFNQYFEFWYQFSQKTSVGAYYMVRKQVLKHFIDYFLDKKSPLKIYNDRPTIGSTYANPNFIMLLRTIQSLLSFYTANNISLTADEKMILINFNFIEKLIHDTYENIATKIVKLICPGSLAASQKIAIVLVKGLSKANYQTVQPYLEVLHEFVLIKDDYQHLRVSWVIGKQALVISTISKVLTAMNSYSLEERIYDYQSALHLQTGTSLLEPMFTQNKRTQNLCMLCLQQLMKLCNQSQFIRHYIWNLGPPSYIYSKYVDFFEEFIHRYLDQAKRLYSYSGASGFSKEEIGKNVKKLYEEVLEKIQKEMPQEQEQTSENKDYEEQKYSKQQKKEESGEGEGEGEAEKEEAKVEVKNSIDFQEEKMEEEEREEMKPLLKEEKPLLKEIGQLVVDLPDDNEQMNIELQPMIEESPTIKQKGLQRSSSMQNNSDLPSLEREKQEDEFEYDYDYVGNQYAENYMKEGEEQNGGTLEVDSQQKIKINIQKSPIKDVSDKENYYSSDDDLIEDDRHSKPKQKKKKYREKVYVQQEMKEVKESSNQKCYHPVKFIYKPVEQLQSGMANIRIQQHSSEVVFVRTNPTGITNKTFASSYSHKKVSERLAETAWQDKLTTVVNGYFVSNSAKNMVRIQTEEGSYFVRSLDSVWVWSKQITRVWIPERFNEWPEWSLYSDQVQPKVDKNENISNNLKGDSNFDMQGIE